MFSVNCIHFYKCHFLFLPISISSKKITLNYFVYTNKRDKEYENTIFKGFLFQYFQYSRNKYLSFLAKHIIGDSTSRFCCGLDPTMIKLKNHSYNMKKCVYKPLTCTPQQRRPSPYAMPGEHPPARVSVQGRPRGRHQLSSPPPSTW